jgi:hypothetical protein
MRKVPFERVDVRSRPDGLKEMMKWSRGGRDVPVIAEDGKVAVGSGGSGGV